MILIREFEMSVARGCGELPEEVEAVVRAQPLHTERKERCERERVRPSVDGERGEV